jgi:hypothetical protein
VGDPTHQHHDWEPGIADSGLFWTIPIAPGMVDVDAASGRARLRGQSVKVTDYHDFFNAVLGGGPTPLPARVAYEVVWHGGGARVPVRDADFGFVGDYVTGPGTISFTARNEHGAVVFTSDAAGQYNPGPEEGGAGSPAVGTERNGVFFH